jgi:hypothetical protein
MENRTLFLNKKMLSYQLPKEIIEAFYLFFSYKCETIIIKCVNESELKCVGE